MAMADVLEIIKPHVTRDDRTQLVRDRLDNNKDFLSLGPKAPPQEIQEVIVEKGEGVFLWLTLVFRNVAEGLLSGDTLTQLTTKVNSLPSELDDRFRHLLSSIHRVDQKEVYTIFAIAAQTDFWPVVRFALVEEYLQDSGFAMKWPP
jgi:hypothetical protein